VSLSFHVPRALHSFVESNVSAERSGSPGLEVFQKRNPMNGGMDENYRFSADGPVTDELSA
ncbi:MAG: hypothetical protein J5494_03310, partial [Candidatus Methanomethylophilaceae archaeon]|nr:hypothetical protein [Candidatus Methanomethylophilaceae archaeon]